MPEVKIALLLPDAPQKCVQGSCSRNIHVRAIIIEVALEKWSHVPPICCMSMAGQGEQLIGARAYRVIFALVSLPLAIVAIVYFINHRYDGMPLWDL
eukprot:scaffold65173_cov18-Tisochrysis_lutea.AAC.1